MEDYPVVRILVADDHQIFIEGLKTVLIKNQHMHIEIAGEANNGAALLRMAASVDADLLLLDINLPDLDGIEVVAKLKEQGSQLKIIALSMYEESKVVKGAFKAGVDGYILKKSNPEELFTAIQTVLTGETYLGHGLSLTNGSGSHSRLLSEGKLTLSYDERFMKKFKLTKRELEVMKLVGRAMTNKEIAKVLYISDQTVSVHRKNIMHKLGVKNSSGLIKIAFENSLV